MATRLDADEVLHRVNKLFCDHGDSMYAGEPVTQTQHALQCAARAEEEDAGASLITAALLHDVGHLLHEFDEDCAQQGIDDRHEQLGVRWLRSHFGRDVYEPVGLHVMAKRYRCAVDPRYLARLSPASELSLRLQGGPLTVQQVEQFESHRYYREALQLREWDDEAKIPGLTTPPLSHFLQFVTESIIVTRV